ncbi:MAG: hypothetical protein JJ902_15745 [Roseibium sp.]|nr:hypothetical protein [Roseibium sp.]
MLLFCPPRALLRFVEAAHRWVYSIQDFLSSVTMSSVATCNNGYKISHAVAATGYNIIDDHTNGEISVILLFTPESLPSDELFTEKWFVYTSNPVREGIR